VTGYSAVKTTYDTYGRVTDVKTFDFGATGATNEKVITYGSGSPTSQTCTAISTYIIGKPCSVTLYDSQNGNAILSQTWNTYDGNGNLKQTWNLVSGSGKTGTYLSKQYSYDSHGVVQTSTDVNGQVMNYTTTSCNNMFVTSQYPTNFTNLTTSQTWDCVGGVVTSATDANGQITQTKFDVNSPADPFYRPQQNIDQLNNVTSFEYTPTSVESTFLFNGGQSAIETLSTLDSTGRAYISQLHQAPGTSDSGNWDTKSRSFDGDGRQYQTSLTCATTAGAACPASTETQTYDALSRPHIHHGTGGDIVTKTYVLNDVLSVLSPAPTGENTKAVQKEYDGLGRLKSSCLISSAPGSGSCKQANAGTGFLTQYFYDGAGRLLRSVENAQVTSPQQARSYTYDLLGRVLTETNPENGTTYSFYDTAPSTPGVACTGTYNGDLVKTYDAQGNTICYTHDGLHRMLTTTYPAGPNSGASPARNFAYDTTSFTCTNGSNVEGRLAEAFTGSSSSKITDRAYCYSARGEVTDIYESTPNSGGYYHITKSYWPDGSLASVGDIPGVPTIYYGASDGSGLDGEGRVTKVTVSSGVNPVTGVTYATSASSGQPIGALTQVTYGTTSGAGDTDSFSYDLNTSRMNQYTFTVNNQSVIGVPTWNANGTLQQLQITQDPFNSANVQTCTYLYDDFVRIGGKDANGFSVDCGAAWQQLFTYDPFGNINKTGTSSWMPGYDQTTNRYSSIPGCPTFSYDNDGNLTKDCFHTYQWDANGHASAVDGINVIYDALGRAVEGQFPDGGKSEKLYDETGLNAVMLGQSMGVARIPLPGGAWARYTPSGLTDYWHPDWQGTSRLESTPGRTVDADAAFAPFGEVYTHADNFDLTFTGNTTTDTVIDMYDFPYRRYHPTQGRWISPDPVRGTGNKYVYADNNPLSKVDPYGLEAIIINGFEMSGTDGELEGSKFGDPFSESESHQPDSTQAPAQSQTEQPQGEGEPPPTTGNQQKAQAAQAQAQGQPAQNKTLSANGLQFIEKHEGYSGTVYKDSAGNPTIGYGHLIKEGEDFSKGITKEKAGELLSQDTKTAVDAVNGKVTANLSQTKFDAVVDFTYNLGGGNLGKSTLLKNINAGKDVTENNFTDWNRAGGKVVNGLTIRRTDEWNLFSKGDYGGP
jgi:lysozyme